MKFAIFDGILETHVASSLERAFISRGHKVYNTGKFGHGFEFAQDPQYIYAIKSQIERVIDYAPDVVIVFRPASLPSHLIDRLRVSGAQIMVWLSDDPVLWKLSYGPVLEQYDHILHCGDSRVLSFYQQQHGRPTGINLPFWTDQEAFPEVYGTAAPEFDGLFLGNVHDQVRRQRYFDLAELDINVRIHGNVGQDYYNIWGGYLDSDKEVIDAASRARFAINIPQFFKDHRGLPTWFDGLGDLGTFQYPSRVIQYAAMGLPIFSVVPDIINASSFPEIQCVNSVKEIDDIVRSLSDSDLRELGKSTNNRFRQHYSARSRVLAIESLLEDDSWKSLSVQERAEYFMQFDGTAENYDSSAVATASPARQRIVTQKRTIDSTEALEVAWDALRSTITPQESRNILVIGTGWTSELSELWTVIRGLRNLNCNVTEGNPYNYRQWISKDPFGHYAGVVELSEILRSSKISYDYVIFVGDDYIPSISSSTFAKKSQIKLINFANPAHKYTNKISRMSSVVDIISVLNKNSLPDLNLRGIINVRHDPEFFDLNFIENLKNHKGVFEGVTIVAHKSLHLSKNRPNLTDLDLFTSRELILEEQPNLSLEELAGYLRSSMLVVLPDTGRPGPLLNRLMGHALVSGSLVVVPRSTYTSSDVVSGEHVLAFKGAGELPMKLTRLADSASLYGSMIAQAVNQAAGSFMAERVLEDLFTTLESRKSPLLQKTQRDPLLISPAVNRDANDQSRTIRDLVKYLKSKTRIRTRLRRYLSNR